MLCLGTFRRNNLTVPCSNLKHFGNLLNLLGCYALIARKATNRSKSAFNHLRLIFWVVTTLVLYNKWL